MNNQSVRNIIWFSGMCLLALGLNSCSRGPEAKPKAASQVREEKDQSAKWRMDTLVGEYERVGSKNPAWDADAKAALESFAGLTVEDKEEAEADRKRTARYSADAMAKGCNDPMIRYFYLKSAYDRTNHTPEENIKAFVEMGDGMSASSYCEIRKFWVCSRAAEWIHAIQRDNRDYYRFRQEAIGHLQAALEDKTIPPVDVEKACVEMLTISSNNKKTFPEAYQAMEGPLFKNFGNTYVPYFLKGKFHVDMAWRSRGTGTSDKVTEEGWKGFQDHLAMAEQALTEGWKVDPTSSRIATEMLSVELGQGKGRERMELWFERAMKTDTRNHDACMRKLNYLQPKWYGSIKAMREFGWQCATNRTYEGNISLLLLDVHRSISMESGENGYYRIPAVWEDIHAAFENYFERNPDSEQNHYKYVWYAALCGHPEVVAEQLTFLKEPINYGYFGGKEAFEEMKRRALAATKK
jgi:hypothetical protein